MHHEEWKQTCQVLEGMRSIQLRWRNKGLMTRQGSMNGIKKTIKEINWGEREREYMVFERECEGFSFSNTQTHIKAGLSTFSSIT